MIGLKKYTLPVLHSKGDVLFVQLTKKGEIMINGSVKISILSGAAMFLLLSGCNNEIRITGEDKLASVQINGDWTVITDKEDFKEIMDENLTSLGLTSENTSVSPGFLAIKKKGFSFSRQKAGLFSFNLNWSGGNPVNVEDKLNNSLPQLSPLLQNAESKSLLSIDDRQFQLFSFEKDETRYLIVSGELNEIGHVIVFYCPKLDFISDYEEQFKLYLKNISFNAETNQIAYSDSESGFWSGVWDSTLLPFRALDSIWEYVDLIPDRNTGLFYVIGFIIGGPLMIALLIFI